MAESSWGACRNKKAFKFQGRSRTKIDDGSRKRKRLIQRKILAAVSPKRSQSWLTTTKKRSTLISCVKWNLQEPCVGSGIVVSVGAATCDSAMLLVHAPHRIHQSNHTTGLTNEKVALVSSSVSGEFLCVDSCWTGVNILLVTPFHPTSRSRSSASTSFPRRKRAR